MAELPEWSAEALRYQGSDGPVKVMYFRSRREVGTSDSFDQYYASRIERPEAGKEISYPASGASGVSDTRAIFSGHLFDPVEVLDSKNYKLQGKEYFEDRESALGALTSKFNNFPRVLPIDLQLSHGPKYSYIEPQLIKRSKEDDLLWYYFQAYATIAKDFEAVQDFQAQKRKELDGRLWRTRMQGYRCQCALIFGITTKFNPSGMWIVEDIFS